jgi:hypothetical protein
MADHDQRFKSLLELFFPAFVRLFFPAWAERFDFDGLEWLREEIFVDPPEGERRSLDLVARLPVRQPVISRRHGEPESWVALLHVEIESDDRVAPFRPRMFDYFRVLRQRHRLPVLPIALFLRVGLEGIGWDVYEEWFWEHRLVHFEYAYEGLPALDAEHYLNGDNWLGVALAALMRVPEDRRAWLKAEALRRLVACPEEPFQRFLLCDCVQAYLPLEGPQLQEFNHLLMSEPYQGVQRMGTTWFEEGMEKGSRRILQRQLEKRFGGPLSPEALARLESWPLERLEDVSIRLLDARSLDELGLGPDRPA